MLTVPQMPPVQYEVTPLSGGLDQVTSAYQLAPGALRDCVNFACRATGGYYRVPGYERFDGQTQPHLANFVPIDITLNPGESVAVGDQGSFGNISGTVSYVDPFLQYVSLTKTIATLSTTFVPGPVVIGGNTIGTATGIHIGIGLRELAVQRAAAANIYRADIQPVPGSGPIRGIVFYNDVAYAFRDNDTGTACKIHKSSVTGWQPVHTGHEVGFDKAGDLPVAGDILTQGSVSAIVERTVVTGGDPKADTAVGYLVLSGLINGSFAAGDATFQAGKTIHLTGAETAIQLSPGGTYNFSIGNFSSSESTRRIYGADGVNDPFEFDGNIYVPIKVTGTSYKARFAQVHANHLFLAMESSLIHSALGDPYNFEVLKGAGEIGTGGSITGTLIQPGNQGTQALMVFARNSTWVLYGTSAQDWNFVNFNVGIGAWEWTAQNLFDAFALDDRGVTMMSQTLKYGNFEAATLTHNIRPFIEATRGRAKCSGLSRENAQYRVYFSDGYGLYVTVGPQGFIGSGLVLFPDIPLRYWDGEYSNGETIALFGDKDGIVYRNDVGSSFDGKSIFSYLNTNINTAKSPRMRKRFRRCMLEVQSEGFIEIDVGYSFEWATDTIRPHSFEPTLKGLSGLAYWDSFIWDTFYWDGRSNDAVPVELNGTGENIQMMVISNNDFTDEFTLPSAIFHFTPRRGNR